MSLTPQRESLPDSLYAMTLNEFASNLYLSSVVTPGGSAVAPEAEAPSRVIGGIVVASANGDNPFGPVISSSLRRTRRSWWASK